jgi:hypothetical protein
MNSQEQRPPFHEAAVSRADDFVSQLLHDTPEIESVSVVFSYSPFSEALPVAVVRGQHGSLQSPAEFIHASLQLWKTLTAQLQAAEKYIRAVDQHMGEQSRALQKLEDQLNATKRSLAEHRESGSHNAGSADVTGSTGSGG